MWGPLDDINHYINNPSFSVPGDLGTMQKLYEISTAYAVLFFMPGNRFPGFFCFPGMLYQIACARRLHGPPGTLYTWIRYHREPSTDTRKIPVCVLRCLRSPQTRFPTYMIKVSTLPQKTPVRTRYAVRHIPQNYCLYHLDICRCSETHRRTQRFSRKSWMSEKWDIQQPNSR